VWLGDQDRVAITSVKRRFGVSTDSDAIRLSLRLLAEAEAIGITPLPPGAQRGEESEHGYEIQ